MWIRTQNGKGLLNVSCLTVSKCIGGKNKAVILADVIGGAKYLTLPTCGEYLNEEKAMDELDRFEKFLAENPNGVYRFT